MQQTALRAYLEPAYASTVFFVGFTGAASNNLPTTLLVPCPMSEAASGWKEHRHMSHSPAPLNDYLAEKRAAVLARDAAIERGTAQPAALKARVSAEGRSGVRRIRIRDHQVISDSPPDFAGYNLGPSSPELQLGVLGSCVTHIFLIQAASRQVPLTSLEVEVSGVIDPRGGKPGHEQTPIWPHDIAYTVHIDSPASRADIDALFEAVERTCPILNLLRNPQQVRASVALTNSSAAAPLPAAQPSAAAEAVPA